MVERRLPTVRDCMAPNQVRFAVGDDVLDAIEELVGNDLAAAAVTDENGGLVGILTEKDCLRAVASAAYANVHGAGRVGDYMSPVETALSPDTDMLSAIETFLANNFPLLPVVEDGRLVGRVTRLDLLIAVRALLASEGVVRRADADLAAASSRPQSIEAMQRSAGRLGRDVLAQLFSRNR